MKYYILFIIAAVSFYSTAQTTENTQLLSIDRIYSGEFRQQRSPILQWIEDGDAYITTEYTKNGVQLVRHDSNTGSNNIFITAEDLQVDGRSIGISSFGFSPDRSKVIIFTNTSRVWRSNTKGDYWVFDTKTKSLRQLGTSLESSSLQFAKLSPDNNSAFYVSKFNLYKEDLTSGTITQLTFNGTDKMINGTFDWAYEEEFGVRDGFRLNSKGTHMAYWEIDASDIGTFYMINNTDSIYSKPVPLQYPKVGQTPSATKVGIINTVSGHQEYLPVQGNPNDLYIPSVQWVSDDVILFQQMNRKQTLLEVYSYQVSTKTLKKIYTEKEDVWIDITAPDISSSGWGENDLKIVDNGKAFLRVNETGKWRHVYKVNIMTGTIQNITNFNYDVASVQAVSDRYLYFTASPDSPYQRYLYRTDLKGKGKVKRLTPSVFSGVNTYNVSPNAKYALHTHQNTTTARSVRFIHLPKHKEKRVLVDNNDYQNKLNQLALPTVKFETVTTSEGITLDARVVYPTDFDPDKKYPVLFHVYGEPWGATAVDTPISLWDIMMTQKGYVVIDMDNRGTPTLKGSEWRKSIYKKIGVINAQDQGLAAQEILKRPYLDESRVAVWGWSGGGSMTENLLFQFPEIYGTGVAVAAVSNQLIYDNIYQERYMGLPQENKQDFINGSPLTHAKNLEGNLLIIHGTADDNVHYQSAELLINELIKHNKQFDFMAYPNRSHSIREGKNTRKHLYTLITNYIMEHTPVNEQ